MELIKADRAYRKSLENLPYQLKKVFSRLTKCSFDLRRKDMTQAILLRHSTYYKSQSQICRFLGKKYTGTGADFFVETVVLFMKAFIAKKKLPWQVASEMSLTKKRGALRPDITVWKEKKLVAVIECKTQLGWNRDGWKQDFERKERKIKKVHPNGHCFLLVMCQKNWSGFGKDKRLGKQFFVLSSIWPSKLNENDLEKSIVVPIELLFKRILKYS